jgi:hypothetical protein
MQRSPFAAWAAQDERRANRTERLLDVTQLDSRRIGLAFSCPIASDSDR